MKHYPCAVCKKSVLNQHKAICCDHCNQWVHIKCNDLNDLDYNLLKSKNEFWYCKLCTSEILPFFTVNSVMSLPKGSLNKSTGALINLMSEDIFIWMYAILNLLEIIQKALDDGQIAYGIFIPKSIWHCES